MNSLNHTELRIVTQWDNFYPYDVYVENDTSRALKLVGGYSPFILKELQFYLNFTYKLITEATDSYNFTRNAEIHAADLFVGSFGVFERRAKMASPTFVTGSSKIVALLNHEYEEGLAHSFIQPFQVQLWIALGIFLICISFCYTFLMLYNPFKQTENSSCLLKNFLMFLNGLFNGFSLLLQKYSNIYFPLSQQNPWRILEWVGSLAVLVLMNCYSGTLVSLLAVKRYEINSLGALLDSQYKINLERGYNNGSTIQNIIEALRNMTKIRKLLQSAKDSGFVYESFEKSIVTVGKTPSAYIIDEETGYDTIDKVLGHMPCSWSTVSVEGIKYPWAFFVNKRQLKIRSAINDGILRMDQSGLLYRGRRTWIPRFTQCYSRITQLPEGVPVNFSQMWSILAFFICGLLSSLFVLIIERFLESKLNNKKHDFSQLIYYGLR